jgi:hypothetical protein
MNLQSIDKELLEVYAKLRTAVSVQVQHRLLQRINQLLDERNRLTK